MDKITLTSMLILFLLTPSSALPVPINGQCSDTWTVFGNSCYKFIAERTSWFNAQDICRLADGHVVTIQTPDENQFVSEMARLHGSSVWIALTDLLVEGHFVWSDTQLSPIYKHWLLGEPNNNQGNENCGVLAIEHGGLWNDAPCGGYLPTVCEKNLSSL